MGTHKFAIDGEDFEVQVGSRRGTQVEVTVNGKSYEVELKSEAAAAGLRSSPPPAPGGAVAVSAPVAAPVPTAAPAAAAAAPTGGAGSVLAPMAGLVLSVKVQVGAQVAVGDELLVLEAMKMENAITAASAGSVKSIAVQPQQTVNQGDLLVEIA